MQSLVFPVWAFIQLGLGLIWLFVVIYVLRSIWTDSRRDESTKLLWSLVVFIFPFGGVTIWWLFGKK